MPANVHFAVEGNPIFPSHKTEEARQKLAACVDGGHWVEALALLADLRRNECHIDSVAVGAAATACARARRWVQAMSVLTDTNVPDSTFSIVHYAIAFAACGRGAQWAAATDLLSSMHQQQIIADNVVLSAAVDCFARGSRWERSRELLMEMGCRRMSPNVAFFTAIVSALVTCGRWELTLDLWGGFRQRRQRVDALIVRAVATACVTAQQTEALRCLANVLVAAQRLVLCWGLTRQHRRLGELVVTASYLRAYGALAWRVSPDSALARTFHRRALSTVLIELHCLMKIAPTAPQLLRFVGVAAHQASAGVEAAVSIDAPPLNEVNDLGTSFTADALQALTIEGEHGASWKRAAAERVLLQPPVIPPALECPLVSSDSLAKAQRGADLGRASRIIRRIKASVEVSLPTQPPPSKAIGALLSCALRRMPVGGASGWAIRFNQRCRLC
eukprot:TRINITY_DN16338_c0_g1_i1.p1 TRINITY_DN16338_c0_g1~~TRINITY_DN16338_c0_g1_i1.p1  ORF type:complete len:455 (+),score=64.53 TRINITY_DN16338_c0_g1_i1:29-1366(+)